MTDLCNKEKGYFIIDQLAEGIKEEDLGLFCVMNFPSLNWETLQKGQLRQFVLDEIINKE